MTTAALLLLLACLSTVSGQDAPHEMDDLCMGCICEAASKCDRGLQCNKGICGLFAITRPYWEDAGSPVILGDKPNKIGAFERCVTEPYCGARTVQEYMSRYPQDCDGNGVINCQDFAALHHLGRGCEGSLTHAYRRDFQLCQRRVNSVGK